MSIFAGLAGLTGTQIFGGLSSAAGVASAFTSLASPGTGGMRGKTAGRLAKEQFDRQRILNRTSMDFSANEARKARGFSQHMSNTAVQRSVFDMKRAGINPILAVAPGGGASTPSSAMGAGASGTASKADFADPIKDQQHMLSSALALAQIGKMIAETKRIKQAVKIKGPIEGVADIASGAVTKAKEVKGAPRAVVEGFKAGYSQIKSRRELSRTRKRFDAKQRKRKAAGLSTKFVKRR